MRLNCREEHDVEPDAAGDVSRKWLEPHRAMSTRNGRRAE
jgi:hypothetical protein